MIRYFKTFQEDRSTSIIQMSRQKDSVNHYLYEIIASVVMGTLFCGGDDMALWLDWMLCGGDMIILLLGGLIAL